MAKSRTMDTVVPRIILILLAVINCPFIEVNGEQEDGPKGYMRREYSLVKPYDGIGSLEYWEMLGNAMVTNDYVRLTADHQSMRGAIWNTMPLHARNWELHIRFRVHGQGTRLFGDGWAFWYTKEKGELGAVFGSKDQFSGLGIFFDTYSNYNDEHSHDHPYISAQVNNGTVAYDHDSDGTHSEVSGCTSYFRGTDTDSFVAIRYLGSSKRLTVQYDIDGDGKFTDCFDVTGVELPTEYYMGFSAGTGDLADNHDIVSAKLYDLDPADNEPGENENAEDYTKIIPHAANIADFREHVYGPKSSTRTQKALGWIFIIVLIGCVAAVVVFFLYQKKQKDSLKRFY